MKKMYRIILCTLVALGSVALPVNARDEAAPVQVELTTDLGAILIEVYPSKAPISAENFLKFVDGGLYENAGFYRTVRHDNDNGTPKIEVIQGGLLDTSDLTGGVAHETTEQTGLKHTDAAVSLARAAVGTGSAAAFFICIGDQPALDYGAARNADKQGFAVFGKVIEGMDVVRKIHQVRDDAATDNVYLKGQILANPVMFRSIKRVTAK
ncbi:peptidylprolyl isomerase [Kordiimonas aquimaris]|uniref:peptidylprolyl isomerase n=1 Tax=Kordiimonas aquimaris TaxID=707591 RepID=UPI0021CF859A|nr:peptidylprolyl isomerase [Kordiimonas aquimaris]